MVPFHHLHFCHPYLSHCFPPELFQWIFTVLYTPCPAFCSVYNIHRESRALILCLLCLPSLPRGMVTNMMTYQAYTMQQFPLRFPSHQASNHPLFFLFYKHIIHAHNSGYAPSLPSEVLFNLLFYNTFYLLSSSSIFTNVTCSGRHGSTIVHKIRHTFITCIASYAS